MILTFAVSYIVGIPFNFGIASLLDPSGLTAIYLPRLVTVLGPAVAAITVACADRGRMPAVRLVRSLRVSVRQVPWLIVIFAVGILAAIAAFRFAGVSTSQLFQMIQGSMLLLTMHMVWQVATVGIGEELGWRGWLLPSLAAERSVASATALTCLVWTAWHLPVLLSGASVALSLVALLAAPSVIFTGLWMKSNGSAGVVAVAHAAVNGPFFFLEAHVREHQGGAAIATQAFAYFAAIYVCIAIGVALAARRMWFFSFAKGSNEPE